MNKLDAAFNERPDGCTGKFIVPHPRKNKALRHLQNDTIRVRSRPKEYTPFVGKHGDSQIFMLLVAETWNRYFSRVSSLRKKKETKGDGYTRQSATA